MYSIVVVRVISSVKRGSVGHSEHTIGKNHHDQRTLISFQIAHCIRLQFKESEFPTAQGQRDDNLGSLHHQQVDHVLLHKDGDATGVFNYINTCKHIAIASIEMMIMNVP